MDERPWQVRVLVAVGLVLGGTWCIAVAMGAFAVLGGWLGDSYGLGLFGGLLLAVSLPFSAVAVPFGLGGLLFRRGRPLGRMIFLVTAALGLLLSLALLVTGLLFALVGVVFAGFVLWLTVCRPTRTFLAPLAT